MQRPRRSHIQKLRQLRILLVALQIRFPQKHTVKLKALGFRHSEHHHALAETALVRIRQMDLMAEPLDDTFFLLVGKADDCHRLISFLLHVRQNFHRQPRRFDPVYTMGDLVRLRLEILAKLQKEGVIELNRSLEWTEIPLRIAVISATGAAGYGDFIHQLYTNPRHLRFSTKLFPAVMQGQQAPGSIIAALESIAAEEDDWDGVVIIRGGGATSDLAAFENYDLAANIAQFPLPVIIGIGHERDVTVLDYVANMRVKTPTAAAEWLISRGTEALDHLEALATEIHHSASAMISASREQLAYISARLPYLPQAAIDNTRKRLDRDMLALSETTRKRLHPEVSRLDMLAERLASSTASIIERRRHRLDSIGELIKVLSPAATLKRGYTITRISGHAVTSVSQLKTGMTIETILPDGTVNSNIL